jgi:hypothetical protein
MVRCQCCKSKILKEISLLDISFVHTGIQVNGPTMILALKDQRTFNPTEVSVLARVLNKHAEAIASWFGEELRTIADDA